MANWRFLNHKYTSMYPMYAFLPLSLIVSFLLLIYNEGVDWEMLQQPGFYIAWGVSFLVSLLLVIIVFGTTLWLDFRFPWRRNYNLRLLYQGFWGILMPTIFSCLTITIYFFWYNINIFKTIWFQAYLPQIVLLLIVFNATLLFYWHRNFNGPGYRLKDAKILDLSTSLNHNDVACIFSHNKVCYAVDQKGVCQIIELTIEESFAQLPTSKFFQINRSFILNFSAIEQLEIKNVKNYFVLLKEPVDISIRHVLNKGETLPKAKQSVKIISSGDAVFGKYKISQGLSTRFEQLYAVYLMEGRA